MKKDKQTLRLDIINKLQHLNGEQRHQWESDLKQQFFEYLQTINVQRIALFYSFHPEVNVLPILEELEAQGYEVYLPCLATNYQLEFAPYQTGDTLKTVYRKVVQPMTDQRLEPELLDLIIVPGLAFSRNGYRVGFGGGYYDRLLAKLPTTKTVSLVFPIQMVDNDLLPVESFDQPVKKLFIAR